MYAFFVICTIIGALFCGLTIDIGMMENAHQQMQSAADAAAPGAQVSHPWEWTAVTIRQALRSKSNESEAYLWQLFTQ